MSFSVSSFSDSEAPCECRFCGQDYKLVEPYPFYPTLCRPLVYLAHARPDKPKHEKKRNLFSRAFQWYTEEHRPQTATTATTSTEGVKEAKKEEERRNEDVSAFANWLDMKYQQFLLQRPENANVCCGRLATTTTSNVCEHESGPETEIACYDGHAETPSSITREHETMQQGDSSTPCCSAKKRFSKFTKARTTSMEYILPPKNMSRIASECCRVTPTPSPSMNTGAKSKKADEIKIDKPPIEQSIDSVKPLAEKSIDNIKPKAKKSVDDIKPSAKKSVDSVKPLAEKSIDDVEPSVEKNPKVAPKKSETVTKAHKHKHIECECDLYTPNTSKKTPSKPSSLSEDKKNETPAKPNEEEKAIKKSDVSSQYETKLKEVQIQCEKPSSAVCCPLSACQSLTSKKHDETKVEGQVSMDEEVQPNREQELQQTDNQEIYPSFHKPCPSVNKTASEQTAPCPSLKEECPARRHCPSLRGPCTSNTSKINDLQQTQTNLSEDKESYLKSEQPVNQRIRPSFQKPCPSVHNAACQKTCPSLLEPCPGKRPCPTLHGPCYMNIPKINEAYLQQQVQLNLSAVQGSFPKSQPPVNPKPSVQQSCRSVQQQCPSFNKPASDLDAPCPSLQVPYPNQRQCPTLRGPYLFNTPQNYKVVWQLQPNLNIRDVQDASSKPQTPVNPNICPTFQGTCPSIASRLVTPCSSLQQPSCVQGKGTIDPRYLENEQQHLYDDTNCVCRRGLPTPTVVRREMCIQCYCNQCLDTYVLPQILSQNVTALPVVQQTSVLGLASDDCSCAPVRTEQLPVISEGMSTKPSTATLACQTSDHSIRLACIGNNWQVCPCTERARSDCSRGKRDSADNEKDKKTIGSSYPLYMKIVCADRLKQ